MRKISIIAITDKGIEQALILQKQFPKSLVVTTRETTLETVSTVNSIKDYMATYFTKLDGICFIGAMGICVRTIAPFLDDKSKDPAVICVDDLGQNVQSVLSGHKGGANDFARKVAQLLGGQPIISTSSDVQNIWPLDTLNEKFDWTIENTVSLNEIMALFVNNKPTALLLDVKDKGTQYLEDSLPDFVTVFYNEKEIEYSAYELLIAVTYKSYTYSIPTLTFVPKVLSIGSGCSKRLVPALFEETLKIKLEEKGLLFSAIKNFGSIDIKALQSAYLEWSATHDIPFKTFTSTEIHTVSVPNPSVVVQEKIGVDGVSESTAMLLSKNNSLLVEKQKVILDNNEKFTFAVSLSVKAERKTQIAIIGAGPGDEELITVKGKKYLEEADCVLYMLVV